MQRRSYARDLEPVLGTDTEFRLSVRFTPHRTLACDLYAQRADRRSSGVLWAHLDTWYADREQHACHSLDAVQAMLVESLMQLRLPGID